MITLEATLEEPSTCFSSVAVAASRAACLECAMRLLSTEELSQRRAPYHLWVTQTQIRRHVTSERVQKGASQVTYHVNMPLESDVLADAQPLAPRLRLVASVRCSSSAIWSTTSMSSVGESAP